MKYAAFLRAVNVAGNSLSMAALKDLLADLGLENPRTVLQSGNVLFSARKQSTAALEELLERETWSRLNVRTDYLVRDANDLAKVVENNPFQKQAEDDPAHLIVFFLKKRVGSSAVDELQQRIRGPETVRGGDRHLYITYPEGVGRSKLTNAIIERSLNTRGTARNWNTVQKVLAALQDR